MKKVTIILWALLAFIVALVIAILIIPHFFAAVISFEIFGFVVRVIGDIVTWILVGFIILCILIYIFSH